MDATRTRAVLRYAVGVTLAVALAQGVAWRLSYLAPVLVCSLLAAPAPLSFRSGIQFIAVIVFALLLGWLAAAVLLPYPFVCVIVVAALLFSVFYMGTRGGSAFVVTMLLIAITLLPVVGQQSLGVVREVGVGLAIAGSVAVFVAWIAFSLLPPPAGEAAPATGPEAPAGLSDAERVRAGFRTTAMILPLQIAFLVFGWSSLLVLMFAALLAQQQDARAGAESARAMVLANMLGGAVAIVAYNLLVLVPSYGFLVALMFLLALLFAERVFRATPTAALFGTAFSAALILIGSSVTPYGGDADAAFYQRLGQILLAGLYVAGAFYFFPVRSVPLAGATAA